MPIKLGLIGTGKMAYRLMPHLRQVGELAITALLDVSPQATADFKAKHGLRAKEFSDVDDFYRNGDIEAVYIATPPDGHASHTLKAAAAGKHVLCEKPMALSLDEARAMVAACQAAGVILNIGYMMRFQVYHQRIKEEIRKGMIGRVTRISAERTCYFEPTSLGWFKDPERSGGGAFADLGCHVMDLICFFAESRVRRVKMVANRFFDSDDPVEHQAIAVLEFENRIVGSAYASWCCPLHDNLVQVYGTGGAIIARRTVGPYEDGVLTIFRPDQEPQVERLEYVSHYVLELRHFAECMRTGRSSPIVSGEAVLESERARFLAYQDALSSGEEE